MDHIVPWIKFASKHPKTIMGISLVLSVICVLMIGEAYLSGIVPLVWTFTFFVGLMYWWQMRNYLISPDSSYLRPMTFVFRFFIVCWASAVVVTYLDTYNSRIDGEEAFGLAFAFFLALVMALQMVRFQTDIEQT